MVTLSSYITRDSMVRVEPGTHNLILDKLIQHCLRDYDETERMKIIHALEGGGRMKDQNMGTGFAITHARLDSVHEIRLAAGLLGQGVRFCKGPPVHTVFCAIIPLDKANEYLGLMARLCRLLTHPGTDKLFGSGDLDRVFEQIQSFDQ